MQTSRLPGARNLLADSLIRLLDVVPDAQRIKEPDDQEFGSYCFEELEPVKMMRKVGTEVIELIDNREYQNDLQESRKSEEKPGAKENSTDEKEAQDTDSKFPEHSNNLQTESAIKTFKMKFDEKPTETRALLGSSECQEDSQKLRTNTCVEITKHKNLKEIKLPLKPKQFQQLQKNDTYCRDMAKKLHKDMELQKHSSKKKECCTDSGLKMEEHSSAS